MSTITQLNSLFVLFPVHQGEHTSRTSVEVVIFQPYFLDILRRHTTLMAGKRFNLIDACASRCLYLSPQEEESTSSSWASNKMDTTGSISNSQSMLTEINSSGSIAKIRIWEKRDVFKNLKAFRITSTSQFHFLCYFYLILFILYFSCLQMYSENVFNIYYHMSLKTFSKSLCPR